MNKIKKIIYLMGATTMLGLLSGCAFGWKTGYVYDNGDQYVPGDREISEKIEIIDVDYLSGGVTLTESASGKVVITETSKKELKDEQKVHTWVDGTTLYVRFCASGKGIDVNRLGKELTLAIPETSELDKIELDVSSGSIDATCSAKIIKLHTSSGSINLDHKGNSERIKAETSSGRVNMNVEKADEVRISVSSGGISVKGDSINDFSASSSSGSGNYTFLNVPATTKIEGSSGSITVNIPKDSNLTADLKTSSGKIHCDDSSSKNSLNYVMGDGSNQMKVHTSSGSVYLKTIAD